MNECFVVLLVQILTRMYPCPTSCIVEENGQRVCVSEIERRKHHIEAVSNEHALKQVALSCLRENLKVSSAASIKKHMETMVKRPEPAVDLICKQNMQVVAEQQHFISQLISEHQILQKAKKQNEADIQYLAERVSYLELDKKTMHDSYQNQLEVFASKLQQMASDEVERINKSLREEASIEIERIKAMNWNPITIKYSLKRPSLKKWQKNNYRNLCNFDMKLVSFQYLGAAQTQNCHLMIMSHLFACSLANPSSPC